MDNSEQRGTPSADFPEHGPDDKPPPWLRHKASGKGRISTFDRDIEITVIPFHSENGSMPNRGSSSLPYTEAF